MNYNVTTAHTRKLERLSQGLIAGFLLCSLTCPSPAQSLQETKKEIVVETREGMILAGVVKGTTDGITSLQTTFGLLQIPADRITRVDGDRFDPERGIIREHTITIDRDGNVIHDYLVPISSRGKGDTVSILVPGKVLQLMDLNRRSLSYFAEGRGDFTRCTVQIPDHYLPAVMVRVFKGKAGRIASGGKVHYSYRYTPRTEQTFRLKFNLPANASQIEATPEVVRDASDSLLWEIPLYRQETAAFNVSFLLVNQTGRRN